MSDQSNPRDAARTSGAGAPGPGFFASFGQDLRMRSAQIQRNPGFALVANCHSRLGIGAEHSDFSA